jgi:hypothetical protein
VNTESATRWPATRWPAAWLDEIRLDSIEIFDGIFEARRGNPREKIAALV